MWFSHQLYFLSPVILSLLTQPMFALYGNNESVRLMNNPCNIKVVMKATVWQRQNHYDWLSCIEIYHPNQNTLQSSPSNSYFPSFSVHGFDLEKNSRESYLQNKSKTLTCPLNIEVTTIFCFQKVRFQKCSCEGVRLWSARGSPERAVCWRSNGLLHLVIWW